MAEESKCEFISRKNNKTTKEHKTREKLNEIEKNRNKKINELLLELRKLLQESFVPTKRDKINILKNTYEHIMKLQQSFQSAQEWLTSNQRNSSTTNTMNREETIPFESLQPSETIYEELFTNTHVPFLLLDINGQIKQCNEAFCQLSGLTETQVNILSLFNLTLPHELADIYRSIATLLSQDQSSVHYLQKTLVFSDDKTILCSLSLWTIKLESSNSEGIHNYPSLIQMMIIPLQGISSSSSYSSSMTITTTTTTTITSTERASTPISGDDEDIESRF